METDRDLLLGVLALQLDFVSREQFVQTYATWSQQSEKRLGEMFVSSQSLTAEDLQILEQLQARIVLKHQGDVRQALEERLDPPLREMLGKFVDSRFALTMDLKSDASDIVRVDEISPRKNAKGSVSQTSDRNSRYSLTRIQGQGGLGRVWLARDLVLQRSVALKEPITNDQLSEMDIHRFVQEAQVTGQLEHPNIVPIYELVHDGDNREVYYTMRFVRGRTLADAITAYHEKLQAGVVDGLELRSLLTTFVSVCQAIAYAHSRGVIHRDLKPSNVMLGSFGEVNLLDWGLAMVIGTVNGDPAQAVQIPNDPRINKSTDGTVSGTLAYMAPEQAAGRITELDHRTDIYGLGAMLFAILTNFAPHRATKSEGTRDILKKIKEEPTPHAKDVLESVPAPLDAICNKAMGHARGARYDSAMELARDVERWLADEEVSVHRSPLSTRIVRWMRRHRTAAISSICALAAISFVSLVAIFFVDNARRKEALAVVQAQAAWQSETAARTLEAAAKQEATRRFRQSQKTVDTMLSGVGEVLEYYPGAKAVRTKLLEEAARSYAEFADDETADPALRLESGRAAVRLGDVRLMLGEHTPAQAAFQSALKIFDGLAADANQSEAAIEAALSWAKLATTRAELEAVATAENDFQEALTRLDKLPDSYAVNSARLTVLLNRARLRVRAAPRQAQTDLETCEKMFGELQTQLADDNRRGSNEHTRLVENLALARSLLGQTLASVGDSEAAVKMLESAIVSYRELTVLQPDFPPYLDGLAFSKITLANALRPSGRADEQRQLLKMAVSEYVTLTESMPETPRFLENLSVARTNFAWALHQRGENVAAQALLDEALSELSNLCRSPVRVPRYLEELAQAAVVLGEVLSDLDENESAATNLKNAIAVYETQLLTQQPGSARYLRGLGSAKRQLANLLRKLDDTEAANEQFASAIEHFQTALLREAEPFARDELALAWEHRAELFLQLGKSEEAERFLATAEETRQTLPQDPEYRYKAAVLAAKSSVEATRDQALLLANQLAMDAPRIAKYQTLLGSIHLQRGDAAAALKVLAPVDDGLLALSSPHHFWLSQAYAASQDPSHREKAKLIFERATERRRTHAPGKVELLELQQRVQKLLE